MSQEVADIIKELEGLVPELVSRLERISSQDEIESLRIDILGRKGKLATAMAMLGKVPAKDKPLLGKLGNKVKEELHTIFERAVEEQEERREEEYIRSFDPTLPPRYRYHGSLHLITSTINKITTIFKDLGYAVISGPEVETEYYNFEALNIPKHHPARDMQDTFFLRDGVVLRTHTSPVQVRTMQNHTPPLAAIVPGKVYRKDSDNTHTPMFHQIEGFVVDKGINFSHLRGTIMYLLQKLFGEHVIVRFRPSFFPFTEPSAEVDISCFGCSAGDKEPCRICGGSRWIEVLGCGMIAPEVFRSVEYDTEVYSGFAFGIGVERIAMLLHRISDLRLFYENDMRFLTQFASIEE